MGISIKQFIDKTYKTKVDVPWGLHVQGDLAGQCVSLVQQYTKQVYDVPLIRRGDAKDYGYNLVRNGFAKEIGYSQLQYGDIIVWGENQGGGFGHIAIYIQPGLIYDQNNMMVAPYMEAQYRPNFGGAIQYLRMNKKAPVDTLQEIAESYAFINETSGLRLRERPSLNARVVGELKVGARYEYDKKVTNDGYTWVSNGKNWVAFRNHKDNSIHGKLTPKLSAAKPNPTPNNKPKPKGTWQFKLDLPSRIHFGDKGLNGAYTGYVYPNGYTVNYDKVYEQGGYTWVSYIDTYGNRCSVAVAQGNVLWGKNV